RRNEVMFQDPGKAYVYFIYGNHFCLNVVAHQTSSAGAVLIRAIEPISGLDQMKKNRGLQENLLLASGPGRLTEALKIDRMFNGIDLVSDKILSIQMTDETSLRCGTSKRIGIRKGIERRWRFFALDSKFVSRR
ncbi:MAG: DNA-3-methyladenine glycosylase, partial [Nitrososphaerales archaeon]